MSIRLGQVSASIYCAQYHNANSIILRLQNGAPLPLKKGTFQGNIENATAYLQGFCNQNPVTYNHFGLGYMDLVVNNQPHDITPYGVDIEMMLQYCGGKTPADFPA